jgi:nitrous oxide reductase
MPVAETAQRMVSRMTLEEIKALKDDFLSASTVASVLRMDTGRLIGYAKSGQLPFPVVVTGNRVKIPRIAFLKQYGLIEEEREEKNSLEQIGTKLDELKGEIHQVAMVLMGILMKIDPEATLIMKPKEAPQ